MQVVKNLFALRNPTPLLIHFKGYLPTSCTETAPKCRGSLPPPNLVPMETSMGIVRPPLCKVRQPYTTLGKIRHLPFVPGKTNLDIDREKKGALVILTCNPSPVQSPPSWTVTYDPGPLTQLELVGMTKSVLAAVAERTAVGKTPLFSRLATLNLDPKGLH